MAWRYQQSTGKLYHNGVLVGKGYSGRGVGYNNAKMEDKPDVGPIPSGKWIIGGAFTWKREGKKDMGNVFRLDPEVGTKTHNRFRFLIHGFGKDKPLEASTGCIIMDAAIRAKIKSILEQTRDRTLDVVE